MPAFVIAVILITSHTYLKTSTHDFAKFFRNATQSFLSRSSFLFL